MVTAGRPNIESPNNVLELIANAKFGTAVSHPAVEDIGTPTQVKRKYKALKKKQNY